MSQEPVALRPPSLPPPSPARAFPWLNLLLFALTVLSTVFVGTFLAVQGLFGHQLPALFSGVLFSATLLLILGTHELGHYFMARLHGVDASLPYFIPVPFGLGTFGAFIRMRGPTPNRRALFDVGLAGPLAGLLVAVPLFFAGLLLAPVGYSRQLFGDSILVRMLLLVARAWRDVPQGHHLLPHPISFAAYIGLFITAVNLLPVGQLDGGHVAYALLGRRSAYLGVVTIIFLVVLGWVSGWVSWYVWAGLIFLVGVRHPPTVDDKPPLDPARNLLGLVAMVTLLMLFAADPFPLFR
ncbi:MAG: site-2 protease family protein [Caldilineae bacterium]|nr:MAG: site-2 protease family protein [Caldilineae bacterium]